MIIPQIWFPREAALDNLSTQRYVINRLVRSEVLSDDIADCLRQTVQVLASVEDAAKRASDI